MSRQKKYPAKPAEEKTKAGKSKRGRKRKGMCLEDRPRMVKILEHPENQRPAMMDSWHEGQLVGSSPGVCHRTGDPGTPSAERVPGGGEPNSAGAPASPAATVGSGAMRWPRSGNNSHKVVR
jgi:hypothetical protein